MQKKLLWVLVLIFLSSCSVDREITNSAQVSLSLEEITQLNSYLDFPTEGNIMKMHSVCYDNIFEKAYAIGIMTPYIAVIEDNEVKEFINSNLDPNSYSLKYLFCDEGTLVAVTDNQIVRIEDGNQEVYTPKNMISAANVFFEPNMQRLLLPVPNKDKIIVLDSNSLEQINVIQSSRAKFLTLDSETILGIETIDASTLKLHWYDSNFLERDSAIISGKVTSAGYNFNDNTLWILNGNFIQVFNLEDLSQEPVVISGLVAEPTEIFVSKDYVAVISDNGYASEINGFAGGVSIIDKNSYEVLENIQVPYRHSTGDIDYENSILYMSNNDGGSVTKLDLRSGKYETIDVSNGAEGGIVLNNGDLIIRNRLGGSVLYHLSENSFEEIKMDQWPVGIVYDSQNNLVYAYDFLVGKIEVVDPEKDEVIESYSVTAGTSDAIGDLAYDSRHQIFYIVVPEKNLIQALNINGEAIKTITLEEENPESLAGAGTIVAGVYEPNNLLYVYISSSSTVYVYDGTNNYELLEQISINSQEELKSYPYGIYVDNEKGRVYVSNTIIDAETQKILGKLSNGQVVVAVDNKRDIILTALEDEEEQEWLFAISPSGELLDSIKMNQEQFVNARFAYDYENGYVYAFYLVSGEVWKFSV
jgi:DNA-binding beta-propeller fold protein YncE